ncbi:hypothetical protein BDV12DRAFT_201102 [Aspergillus spectabilis]
MSPRTREDQTNEDTPNPSQSALLDIITRQNEMIDRLSQRLEKIEFGGQLSNQDSEVEQFRKEVKTKLGEPKVILQYDNFEAWRNNTLMDAHLIDAGDMLLYEQVSPPSKEMNPKLWWKKNDIIFTRMLQSIHHTIKDTLGKLESTNAVILWQQLHTELGLSRAEERIQAIESLRNLRLQNGNYFEYQRRFKALKATIDTFEPTVEDFYHDFFVKGLGNWQQTFMQSKLDDFYSTRRGPIQNIDLLELMNQLSKR